MHRVAFMPHTEEVFRELFKLLDYVSLKIRLAAMDAVCNTCCALAQVLRETPKDTKTGLKFTFDCR